LFVEDTVVIKVLVESRTVEWKETAIVSPFLNDDNPLQRREKELVSPTAISNFSAINKDFLEKTTHDVWVEVLRLNGCGPWTLSSLLLAIPIWALGYVSICLCHSCF
jgi:hypothetical protein